MSDEPACPTCGDQAIPVLFGLPTSDAVDAAGDGMLVLAGCIGYDDAQHWACPNGHRWAALDTSDWLNSVRAALRGRPPCPTCAGPSVELLYPSDPDLDAYADDLALGDAVMTDAEPPGSRDRRRCQVCGGTW